MVRLETKRLYIRDLVISDLDDHHDLISNEEVMYYIQDIQTHSLEESRDNLLFSMDEANKKNRKCYFFGIFLKDNHDHVGSIGFTVLDKGDSGNAELGYFIHKRHWHKGYTFEASQAVVKYAFEIGMQKMTTGCVYMNSRSENIMKKLGMFKEGHLYKHTYIGDQWLDRVTYGCYNPKYLSSEDKLRLTYVRLANMIGHMPYHYTGFDSKSSQIMIDFLEVQKNKLEALFKEYKVLDRKSADYCFLFDDYEVLCNISQDKDNFFLGESIEVSHFVPLKFKLTGN